MELNTHAQLDQPLAVPQPPVEGVYFLSLTDFEVAQTLGNTLYVLGDLTVAEERAMASKAMVRTELAALAFQRQIFDETVDWEGAERHIPERVDRHIRTAIKEGRHHATRVTAQTYEELAVFMSAIAAARPQMPAK